MTLIEMLVVIVMMGILLAILVPRFRQSPRTKVRQVADQVVRDLELARGRALSTRSWARVVFNPATQSYTGYLDFNRDSAFSLNQAEIDSLHGFRQRTMADNVVYGRGAAPDVPGFPGVGNITFTGSVINFDARGLTNPFGTKGVIYLGIPSDPTVVAAVTVSGGAGIRTWVYNGTVWQ
jgi:type II secretory pathway pseudopilin PulG